jgi:ubiquinone/menaquinone biosynthesis C-methylase UbiE
MTKDKKQLSNAYFSKEAAHYDRSSKYARLRASYSPIADEALNKPFQTVLDIGCGTGALLQLIQEKRTDVRLFGVDLSEQMIQVAKAKLGEKADLRVSDSEKIPFPNEAFDLVMCTFSFHHYPNPGAVLLEVRRVLASSGRLILADTSPPIPLRQLMNFVYLFTKDGTVRIYSKKEMKALAEAAALEVVQCGKLDWHSYLLMAAKKSR